MVGSFPKSLAVKMAQHMANRAWHSGASRALLRPRIPGRRQRPDRWPSFVRRNPRNVGSPLNPVERCLKWAKYEPIGVIEAIMGLLRVNKLIMVNNGMNMS